MMDQLASILIFAQEDYCRSPSYFEWVYQCLGLFYGLLIPLSGLAVFIGGWWVVKKYRQPGVIAAYTIFLPLPVLIGVYGTVQGAITAISVISTTSGRIPPEMILESYVIASFTTLVGLLVSFPAYCVVSIGLFVRTVQWYRRDKLT